MRIPFTVLLFLVSFSLFSQFSLKKQRTLKKLDQYLSNGWKESYNSPDLFADKFPDSYYIALLTEETENNGTNIGVSILIVPKQYKEQLLKDIPIYEFDIFEFVETKKYIIRINYCNQCGQKYSELTPKLLTEIKEYFKANYSKL